MITTELNADVLFLESRQGDLQHELFLLGEVNRGRRVHIGGVIVGVSEWTPAEVLRGLARYVKFLKSEGLYAQGFSAVGTDVSDEICGLARTIYEKNPTAVFFGGQIVFPEDSFLSRLLFNHTTFVVQRRLHQIGIPFLVMPVRVQ